MLREHQTRAINELYEWFRTHEEGNPCLVLPTGAGKSYIIAALCHDALQNWPTTRVLMLTHMKELIEQNAEKMRIVWPNAPMGIYSASVGRRQLGEPITFAGIQSVRNKADLLGRVDLVIVDECHLISHKEEGGYRSLINDLTAINPSLRVVGLTGTPYRLGHGLITDKPALFDDLIEPTSIEELIHRGYLAPLRSKVTDTQIDIAAVHKRGGEFIESELQEVVNTDPYNSAIVSEIIARAGERQHWLLFCAGVAHSEAMCAELRRQGVVAECVTGKTPKAERESILRRFKQGEITALTNANILTTGFDAPDTDLIAMVRPTMSPALYVQMAGRGLRPKSHTDHCLVLDFAGVVATHGPITAVQPPTRQGGGVMPARECPTCGELCAISQSSCPACGHVFEELAPPPPKEATPPTLYADDIMGLEQLEMEISDWRWRLHTSKTSGKAMLAISYDGLLSDPTITEYLTVTHDGYAGVKAREQLRRLSANAGASLGELPYLLGIEGEGEAAIVDIAERMTIAAPPKRISYKRDGKFYRVLSREWI